MDSAAISKKAIEQYIADMKDGFTIEHNNGFCYISTPFLDPSGDYIDVKSEYKNGTLLITDGGTTLDYLFIQGVELTAKRKKTIERALNINRAFWHNEQEIAVKATSEADYGNALYRLFRAIMSIQYIIYTIKPASKKIFSDEVATFFTEHRIDHSRQFKLAGKAKEHRVDIYVPERNNKIAVAVKTLSTNKPSYSNRIAENAAFSFIDIKETNRSITTVSVIDDREDIWTSDSKVVLDSYSDYLITWSNNKKLLPIVA